MRVTIEEMGDEERMRGAREIMEMQQEFSSEGAVERGKEKEKEIEK